MTTKNDDQLNTITNIGFILFIVPLIIGMAIMKLHQLPKDNLIIQIILIIAGAATILGFFMVLVAAILRIFKRLTSQ